MTQPNWKQSLDLSESTGYIQIYTDEDLKQRLAETAEEQGYSLSRFSAELLLEALILRDNNQLSSGIAVKDDSDLQNRVDELEQRLQEKESESANAVSFDPGFVKDELLTTEFQTLENLLKELVENGYLDELLRQPLENQLYYLAAQNEVEFETGWGWKVSQE